MYRTTDPRFRRRINDLTHTLESANESAQSGLYIFAQSYIRPCFTSIGSCLTTCVDASCPSLNLAQRDRLRRQRGRARSRGRAERSFDFYDDWDQDEIDGLLGWGNDDLDRLLAANADGAGAPAGYGTVSAQPARQRGGMSYPKPRRKSAAPDDDAVTVIPGSSGFWRRLFGGKPLTYKPSAADLQDRPRARRRAMRQDLTEGEALLEEDEFTGHGRLRPRSGTQGSRGTESSYSSRGDIFPSDEEDDAIPLDDEFAMVLERRGTLSGPDTETNSTKSEGIRRGKRPSAGSRKSTRTCSSQSTQSQARSSRKRRSRTNSHTQMRSLEDQNYSPDEPTDIGPSLAELKRQEAQIAREEEEQVLQRRRSAQRLAAARGLAEENLSDKEAAPPRINPSAAAPSTPHHDFSQLPTPIHTDDDDDDEEEEEEIVHSKPQTTTPLK